jgi:hypothetical protein
MVTLKKRQGVIRVKNTNEAVQASRPGERCPVASDVRDAACGVMGGGGTV